MKTFKSNSIFHDPREFVRGFVWGPVAAVHDIGDYTVIEFHPKNYDAKPGQGDTFHPHTEFHPYISGKDISMSFSSLDEALVGAIAYRRDGCNSSAAHYFFKMTARDETAETD